MAKDPERLRGGFDVEETGGALSGLLAEEDEFDRRTLWRLGTWAAVSVGAVVLAFVTNQSSIGLRREQTATVSVDLVKQAQQLQLATRESQNETRRLASAVDTLNNDRDRLYSRVAVLEQGLDSVTGAIARQAPAPSPPQAKADSPTSTNQVSASPAPPVSPSAPAPASTPSPAQPAVSAASTAPAPTAPAPIASADPSPATTKPAPAVPLASAAPVVAPVAATAPAVPDKTPDRTSDKTVLDKKDKQASAASPSEPGPAAKSASAQQGAATQPFGSLVAPKSMMGPPDPAAGKLIEAPMPPKTVTVAPLPEIAAVAPKEKPEEADAESSAPVLVVRRTEFGVDIGGANSIPGLRALWRGLLKSRTNVALATLRPIIVIKENNNGLGMQLRLVAGPINDAAAAAKICASLTVSERGCTTAVFEGQRLSMGADDQPRAETRTGSESKPVSEAKPAPDAKPGSNSRFYGHHRYVSQRAAPKEDDPPKQEPSTLSRLFSSH